MSRYMVFPQRGDYVLYKPHIKNEYFPDLPLAHGGARLTLSPVGKDSVQSAINDRFKENTTIIAYDFEHWEWTPQSEQSDPVGSVDKGASMAHNVGLKFMFNPDGGYMILKNGSPTGLPWYRYYHWKNVDYCAMQTQADFWAGGFGSGGTDVTKYQQNIKLVTDFMKGQNPNIKVWPQLSFAKNSPDLIIKKINSIANIVDGIILFFTDNKTVCPNCYPDRLQQVCAAMRPAL